MEQKEFLHILAAIIIFTIVISLKSLTEKNYSFLPWGFIFAAIIISVNIAAKKFTANYLDSDVEHEIWQWQRYGIKNQQKLKSSIPAGIILPLIISLFSLGSYIFLGLLTYETRALKSRASKRHGFYSFSEMTDSHNALIGAAGILSIIILSVITYLLPIPQAGILAKLSIYYAFWNILPISKFDGTQIYFGSPVLYAIIATITLIFTALALITI